MYIFDLLHVLHGLHVLQGLEASKLVGGLQQDLRPQEFWRSVPLQAAFGADPGPPQASPPARGSEALRCSKSKSMKIIFSPPRGLSLPPSEGSSFKQSL